MQKLWSRHFIIAFLISLSVMLGHYMLTTSLPAFLTGIGGSATDAGLLGGVFTLASLLSRPFVGKIIDRRGRRVVLVAGVVIILLSTVIYPFLAIVPLLILLRIFHGCGYSASTTALNTAVADIVPRSRLSEGVAYIGIAGTIATAFGPFIGLGLAAQSFSAFFTVLALLGLFSLGGAGLMNYEKVLPAGPGQSVKGKLFEKSALPVAIVYLIMALPLEAMMIFIAGYGTERGFQQISLFYPVHALAMVLSRLLLGRLVDRTGPNRIMLSAMLLGVFSLAFLAFAKTDGRMIIAAFIFGIPMGISITILQAILVRTSPHESLGAANATMMAFADIGFGLGAIIMGYVIEFFGFKVFFLLAAGCFSISLLAYIALLWIKMHRAEAAGPVTPSDS
jgi:MFS family permease